MDALRPAIISAAGHSYTVVGRHSSYLRGLDGYRAEDSFLPSVISGLPSGSTLLDVGANIGAVTLAMAALRPDCQVIAFEPVPSNLDCLRENVSASGLPNIEVVAAAVSDASGFVPLSDNGPWSVAGADGGVSCRAVRLDEFDSPSVAFVKIDVEGFEPNVLAGGGRVLSRHPLMLIEFNTWTLLLHHYDPLAFAEALWAHCEVLGLAFGDKQVPAPADASGLVHTNLVNHGCVSDILLRPRSPLPDLATMTEAPAARRLRREMDAILGSTSWRVTAPLRALGQAIRRQ